MVRGHGFHTTILPLLTGALLTPNYLTCIFRFGVGEQVQAVYTVVRAAATVYSCRLRILCYPRVSMVGFEPTTPCVSSKCANRCATRTNIGFAGRLYALAGNSRLTLVQGAIFCLCAPSRIRTDTVLVLSQVPLPLGYRSIGGGSSIFGEPLDPPRENN